MRRFKKVSRKSHGAVALVRLGLMVSVALVLVTGVTFATLQSQQVKLSGNSIQTATANLAISQDGVQYGTTQEGFVFGNIVPGGQALPYDGYGFYLKNTGGAPLTIKFSVSSTPTNADAVDLSKVNVLLVPSGGGSIQNIPLATLIAANTTGGVVVTTPTQLSPGQSMKYSLQVAMAADAVNKGSATLNNIDFAFSGVVQTAL